MPNAPQRIALVRMDNLGDHVLGAGVMRALRDEWPGSELVVFVPAPVSELYARCTLPSSTVALPPAATYLRNEATFAGLMDTVRSHGSFDLVINPRFAEDWYAAAALCGALADRAAIAQGRGRVLGFRQTFSPLQGFDPNGFYTELLEAPETLHSALYAPLIASAAIGRTVDAPPQVWFDAQDWLRVADCHGLVSRGYVVVGLGASFPYKHPSMQTYQHIVRTLLGKAQRVVLTGTEADQPVAQTLVELGADQVVSTCGRLRLFELSALLAHARCYIGPDAGPKHLAAASRTPVLEIAWVPFNYPASSRGPGTAGACWAAWQTLSRTVYPAADVFASASARPGFQAEPIGGIDPDSVEQQVLELLALTA